MHYWPPLRNAVFRSLRSLSWVIWSCLCWNHTVPEVALSGTQPTFFSLSHVLAETGWGADSDNRPREKHVLPKRRIFKRLELLSRRSDIWSKQLSERASLKPDLRKADQPNSDVTKSTKDRKWTNKQASNQPTQSALAKWWEYKWKLQMHANFSR